MATTGNGHSEGANPTWTSFVGVISVLLTLEFWVHLLVPFLRQSVPYPFWPTGATSALLVSALLALLAAIRGSRLWWVAVFCAAITLAFLFFILSG
jgi:hypothetical protein